MSATSLKPMARCFVATAFALVTLSALMVVSSAVQAQTSTPLNTQNDTAQSDWTEFLKPNMRRWNAVEKVLGVNTAKNLQLKWRFGTGLTGAGGSFYDSPIVSNGLVYVGDATTFYALNRNTGQEVWSSPIACVWGGPAAAGGTVFFNGQPPNSVLWALGARTGSFLWGFGGYPMNSAPTVVSGVVYFGSDNSVYAVDAGTGDVLWSYTTGNLVWSSPAVSNGVVYFGSVDGKVYAVNASSGSLLWSFTTGYSVWASAAVANGVVYIGSGDTNVYALDAATGSLLWQYTTGETVIASPAVANGVVYIGSDDGNLYALNATTGARLWSFSTGGDEIYSSPAVANGVVYFGSFNYNIYALNAATGAQLWNYKTGYFIWSSPVVSDGVLYVGSSDAYFYAFGLKK